MDGHALVQVLQAQFDAQALGLEQPDLFRREAHDGIAHVHALATHPRDVRTVEAVFAQPGQDVLRVVVRGHQVAAAQALQHCAGKVARQRVGAFAAADDGLQHHAGLLVAGLDAAQDFQRIAELPFQVLPFLPGPLQLVLAEGLFEHAGFAVDVGQGAHLIGRGALQAQAVLDQRLHVDGVVAQGGDIGFLGVVHGARVEPLQMFDAAFQIFVHADVAADFRGRHIPAHAQRLFDDAAEVRLDLLELASLGVGQIVETVVDRAVAAGVAQFGAARHHARRNLVLQRLLGGVLEMIEELLRGLAFAVLAEHVHYVMQRVQERMLLEGVGSFDRLAQHLHGFRADQHAGMGIAARLAHHPVGQLGQTVVEQLAVLRLDVVAHPLGLGHHLLDAVAGQRPPLGQLRVQVARHDVGDLVAVLFAQGADEAAGGRLVGRDLRVAARYAIPGAGENVADVALAGSLQIALVAERETRVGAGLGLMDESAELDAGHGALLRPSWRACRQRPGYRTPARARMPARDRPGGRPSARRS
ncbi:hypothetical protein D9M72_226020 [compost metagenome]